MREAEEGWQRAMDVIGQRAGGTAAAKERVAGPASQAQPGAVGNALRPIAGGRYACEYRRSG